MLNKHSYQLATSHLLNAYTLGTRSVQHSAVRLLFEYHGGSTDTQTVSFYDPILSRSMFHLTQCCSERCRLQSRSASRRESQGQTSACVLCRGLFVPCLQIILLLDRGLSRRSKVGTCGLEPLPKDFLKTCPALGPGEPMLLLGVPLYVCVCDVLGMLFF